MSQEQFAEIDRRLAELEQQTEGNTRSISELAGLSSQLLEIARIHQSSLRTQQEEILQTREDLAAQQQRAEEQRRQYEEQQRRYEEERRRYEEERRESSERFNVLLEEVRFLIRRMDDRQS